MSMMRPSASFARMTSVRLPPPMVIASARYWPACGATSCRVPLWCWASSGISTNDEGRATLAKFSVASARRCLRLAHRRFLTQQLISPLYSWAGAFACISEQEAEELRAEVLYAGSRGCCFDAAKPILLELIGWTKALTKDPVFMRRWCVFHGRHQALAGVGPAFCGVPHVASCDAGRQPSACGVRLVG